MNISIVSGSNRSEPNSLKVAEYIKAQLLEDESCTGVNLIDLSTVGLPMWDGSDLSEPESKVVSSVSEQLKSSDGFVIISPEWHGMSAPALKNFFLFWGQPELAHKPALPVAVSSGIGGAYPIAELRMSSYKNNRLCYVPENLIVRDVDNVLNGSDVVSEEDGYIRSRIGFALNVLKSYTTAMSVMRRDSDLSDANFKNGM